MNLDGNKLANLWRDIMNKKELTDFALREIKEKVIADVKDIDSGNVGIRDGDVDDRDESTGGASYTDIDTRVPRTRNVKIKALGDIPIDEGSEDEFELVGESNHVSYDSTGNNTIMSHPSVNENSKTVTLKNERVIKLEKKTMMLIIFRFEKTEAISMSQRENLTKVKIKKSLEKYIDFANLIIQEFCDDIELDMNYTNTMSFACPKTVESKLGVKPKKKRKLEKYKKPKWEINIEKEIEAIREMSILRNKDPKTREPGRL